MRCFIFIIIFLFCTKINAQKCDQCVQLSISGNHKVLRVDSLNFYEITYTVKNCSNTDLVIFIDDFPKDPEMGRINIKLIGGVDGKTIYYSPHDERNSIVPINNAERKLKKAEQYSYKFKLTEFYKIKYPGKYILKGYYEIPLTGDKDWKQGKGYYLQASPYITLDVIR